MDDQLFDRLARGFGSRLTRRQSMAALAGAAASLGVASQARAGVDVCEISCPGSLFQGTDSGMCTGGASFTSPIVTEACGDVVPVCVPTQGDQLALGNTEITCTIPDSSISCSFFITVFDTNPFEMTCPANISMEANEPTAVEFGAATVDTICRTDIFPTVCDFASGDVFPLGTTTVTCERDFNQQGNSEAGKGPDCSFTITLAPAAPTATPTETPTEAPATTAPTTVPGDPTATDVPATELPTAVDPTSVPGDPTATATPAPVTELPNTGTGGDGNSTTAKLLPVAVAGAGVALLARLGLRQKPGEANGPTDE